MGDTYQLQLYWERIMDRLFDQDEQPWLTQKLKGIEERGHRLQRLTFHVHPYRRMAYEDQTQIEYLLTLSLLIKSGRHYFMEEGHYYGYAGFLKGELLNHRVLTEKSGGERISKPLLVEFSDSPDREGFRFTYDRREAVRYADRWWDSYNPAYRSFDVDCTNYVSQCIRAGGGPTWGSPNRTKGWWYGSRTWSYSWTVAHALRWYLGGARNGLTATEVSDAHLLSPGDIICYDFEGDGRFDHNTFVVRKDANGMPLVNAHTSNSRHRYWAYEDSTAYTPDIKYKFYKIDG